MPLYTHNSWHGKHRHGPMKEAKAMPLCMAGNGGPLRVVKVRAGHGLQKRLADMGLTPGTEIRLINSQRVGPVLIDIKGSRLALGHGMAMKILVEVV